MGLEYPKRASERRGTFTGQCHQPLCAGDAARHPADPEGTTATLPPGDVLAGGDDAQCFSTARGLAHTAWPKRDPSRTVLAWPLRHRPLPSGAGCIDLLAENSGKDFWTGTAPPR